MKAARVETTGLIKKASLIPAGDLRGLFEAIHNYIYANEGLTEQRAFHEILKLLFMKTADELSRDSRAEFCITEDESSAIQRGSRDGFVARMDSLFTIAKKRYPGIFGESEKIGLSPQVLAHVVNKLSRFTFEGTPADVKGTAFQTLVYAHFRGARGEYFTPYPVTNLCIGMLSPDLDDMIVDPACGFGGFLVESVKQARAESGSATHQDGLTGIELVSEVAAVAEMQLISYGYPDANVIPTNALDTFEKINESALSSGKTPIRPDSYNLVVTNPPFGSKAKVADPHILKQYQLARKWKRGSNGKWMPTNSILSGQPPEILFIERCLQLLKEGGRIAIVLPEGILSNQSLGYVREFIRNKTRILGIVSLPPETFLPYGSGSKTCILVAQRTESPPKDYSIFLATCERVGYDSRGKVIIRGESRSEPSHLGDVEEVGLQSDIDHLDTDIPAIVKAYRQFEERELP